MSGLKRYQSFFATVMMGVFLSTGAFAKSHHEHEEKDRDRSGKSELRREQAHIQAELNACKRKVDTPTPK